MLPPIKTPWGSASAATLSIMGLFVDLGINKRAKWAGRDLRRRCRPGCLSDPDTTDAGGGVAGMIPTSILRSGGAVPRDIYGLHRLGTVSLFCDRRTRRLRCRPACPEAVSRSFSALIPIALTLSYISCRSHHFSITPFETAQNFIYTVIQQPLRCWAADCRQPSWRCIIVVQLFWFFGLHRSDHRGLRLRSDLVCLKTSQT